ncbi:hypothetical protein BECAL_00469 [Bellilinea caldifistulae]|uniref:DUF5667 domain-containing protein n=1 Tax=Bellilinea caldifistulae TaxID=360411 RepID=A0A0P6WYN0_9CHLR|nr:DUF5667 domain-containing protein [Bellilinea caldifistulae]KPL75199.1 hypothetical protein AC812_09520 [Bellilinea caldifistulae]GAP09327.1 hypothetical protein BECAL_00469 [Bellilinea caldifistulae]
MKSGETAQLLEECLQRMQIGEPLERILADYPERAEELRPLLESARMAQANALYLPPVSGNQRSRAQFLEEAARQARRQPKRAFALPRFAPLLLSAVMLVLVAVFGLALASGRSLPGQPLYGMKRSVEQAQLALSGDALGRIALEDTFDQRRAEEVRRLILAGKEQPVEFSGFLTRRIQDGYDQWSAGGIDFSLSGSLQAAAGSMAGGYVDIRGFVRGQQGLEVTDMRLRLYPIGGILQSQTEQEWIIEGVRVRLPSLAELEGTPEVGKPISVTAIRVGENDFLALSARAGRLNPPQTPTFTPNLITPTLTETTVSTATLTPQSSPTPRPILTATQSDDSGKATDDDSGKGGDDDNSGKGGGDKDGYKD